MALVNIMLLAGLGIDVHALVELFGVILRLTVLPTFIEVAVISVLSVFFLSLPWLWAILLGSVDFQCRPRHTQKIGYLSLSLFLCSI